MEANIGQPTWEELSCQYHLQFGPSICRHKLGELAKLRQLGTVAEYQEKFEHLVSRAGTLIQAQKVEIYVNG